MRQDGRWTLLDVVEQLGAVVYGDGCDDEALATTVLGRAGRGAGMVIDARQVEPGDVFVALLGTRTHGIEHAAQAFERGASAVVAGTDLEVEDERWDALLSAAAALGPVVVATDCDGVTMLGRLARAWRRRARWQVVGITGSSGKTGTKDLLHLLLERAGIAAVASHANHNNEIGVPLTLLDAEPGAEVVICEMGMRGLGQIRYLCEVADPDIGIVTNAGTAHLELLGSREAIVQAKAELLGHTWAGGVGIFPTAQEELLTAAERVPDRLLPFGVGPDEAEAAVVVTSVDRAEHGIAGTIDLMGTTLGFSIPRHGLHHARNLAAAAAALVTIRGSATLLPEDVLQLDPHDAGGRFTAGRGDRHGLDGGGIVIADAYNANPDSMRAALDELAATTGSRRVAVLGWMAELGPDSPALHAEVGSHAAAAMGVDELVVVGSGPDVAALCEAWRSSRGVPARCYGNPDEALAALDAWSRPGDAILVKASNAAGLGRLVEGVVERLGGGAPS